MQWLGIFHYFRTVENRIALPFAHLLNISCRRSNQDDICRTEERDQMWFDHLPLVNWICLDNSCLLKAVVPMGIAETFPCLLSLQMSSLSFLLEVNKKTIEVDGRMQRGSFLKIISSSVEIILIFREPWQRKTSRSLSLSFLFHFYSILKSLTWFIGKHFFKIKGCLQIKPRVILQILKVFLHFRW